MSRLLPLGLILFAVGFLPHLAFIFFSPGLGSNGIWDFVLGIWSTLTLATLIALSWRFNMLWFLTAIQIVLMTLLIAQALSDAAFYIGT